MKHLIFVFVIIIIVYGIIAFNISKVVINIVNKRNIHIEWLYNN